MTEETIRQIGPAAVLDDCGDPRFKTMRVSVNLLLPLAENTAAPNAILPGLVTRASREYPDFASLNRRLAELYGASLSTGVRKLGGFQCLTLSAGGIASRYAFGGEDMTAELSELLFSTMFDPLKDEAGLFPAEHFEQEQRQLLEMKDSEFNDKIAYAHRCCERLLFAGQPAGLDRYGSREQLAALQPDELPARWENILRSAHFLIFTLGDCKPQTALFEKHFGAAGSRQELSFLPFTTPETVRRQVEEQALSQSKLSMGFRVDCAPEARLLFQLMSAVLGGVPSSKLFRNVREKMSLCYYCSSSFSPLSRALYIESGVETENLERAEEEIMKQLAALQAGDLTADELNSAKLALCNSFRSVRDSLGATENWRLSQAFSARPETPEEAVAKVMSFTAEQVTEAACRLHLGAVYSLKGCETV